MITTNLTGNIGNHMWQYAVCRTIAEKLGYEWGVNSSPTHDYFNGKNQMYFMDINFGKPVQNIQNEFHEKWVNIKHVDEANISCLDKEIYNIKDNTILLGHKGAFGGLFQDEAYFDENEKDVKSWFKIKPEYKTEYENKLKKLNVNLDENTCVINFRGGEYRGITTCLLRREYWRDCINYYKSINPEMKFIIITDDPECANQFIPYNFPTYHIDIGFDFYVVNQAKWLIISNSTFGWWAAWLNERASKILAPKYWARHNVSVGYWSVGKSYTKNFYYMDREGKLSDYNTCKIEAELYYKTNNLL